jgi:hypothetical protein
LKCSAPSKEGFGEIRNYFKSLFLNKIMKKSIIFIVLGLLLLTSFCLAEEINSSNNEATNSLLAGLRDLTRINTTKSSTHPYLGETISYSWFRIIGIPEPLSRKDFIIYLCLFIAVFAIVFEVVNISGIIEQKWINFCIALIILLLGNYSVNVTYIAMNQITGFANILTFFTEISWIKAVIGIALIIGFFFLLRWGIGYFKRSAQKENLEEFGNELKLVKGATRIEARRIKEESN